MRLIIVHTLDHALCALAAAKKLDMPVILQSAPDAIFYAGSLYLLHMFAEAKAAHPAARATCILDCADAHAEAVAAMQMGHTHIRSNASQPVLAKLTSIAQKNKIILYTEPFTALDLRYARDPEQACENWLENR